MRSRWGARSTTAATCDRSLGARAHYDAGQVAEAARVCGDEDPSPRRGRGGDEEIVRSGRTAGAFPVREEHRMRARNIEVIVLDSEPSEQSFDERPAAGAPRWVRQLHPHEQFGSGHGGDGEVVAGVRHRRQTQTTPLRIDEDARVQDQPVQLRSSM